MCLCVWGGGDAGDYLSLTSTRRVTVICVCWSIFFVAWQCGSLFIKGTGYHV